jgi:squalene-associated FAD-dependent desaturase
VSRDSASGRVYVLGAGLAGLGAATRLAEVGHAVTVLEAARNAGGRCRTFFDTTLDTEIDNGNHLVLSGNTDAMHYLGRIDAMARIDIRDAVYPFVDISRGESWRVDLGRSRLPWWILSKRRRVPGTHIIDYLQSRALLSAGAQATVADVLGGTGLLYERFWKPFSVAVLNTAPEEAAASLLAPVIRETLANGGMACRPVLCRQGLGDAFVNPALGYLASKDADVRLGARVRGLVRNEGRVTHLEMDGETIALGDADQVISAVPPNVAADLIDDLIVPDDFRPIVNAHFKTSVPTDMAPITGLLGGLAEWLFVRGDIASVTVSAAAEASMSSADDLIKQIWTEIAPLLGASADALPAARIIKEKRATIAQTPAMVRRRAPMQTQFRNLRLCGDWTDTGLPATIEGALRSGHRAADSVLKA